MNEIEGAVHTTTVETRRVLIAFCVLTLVATNQLFVLSEYTDAYFAWRIRPPLTAAFLGAGFASGFVLVFLSVTERVWANVRLAFLTIFVFTVVTLVATLLHLRQFHWVLGLTTAFGRFAALFWLIVYIAVPIAMVVALRAEARAPGADPPRIVPLPRWIAGLLAAQGITLLLVGALLFLVPSTASWLWPWPLPPLNARAVAAWLLAFGGAAALGLAENDVRRLKIPAIAYTVFAVLQLLAVARYAIHVQWESPPAWAYVAGVAGIGVTGAAGWRAAALAHGAPTKPNRSTQKTGVESRIRRQQRIRSRDR
jgi:hypothetical protein